MGNVSDADQAFNIENRIGRRQALHALSDFLQIRNVLR